MRNYKSVNVKSKIRALVMGLNIITYKVRTENGHKVVIINGFDVSYYDRDKVIDEKMMVDLVGYQYFRFENIDFDKYEHYFASFKGIYGIPLKSYLKHNFDVEANESSNRIAPVSIEFKNCCGYVTLIGTYFPIIKITSDLKDENRFKKLYIRFFNEKKSNIHIDCVYASSEIEKGMNPKGKTKYDIIFDSDSQVIISSMYLDNASIFTDKHINEFGGIILKNHSSFRFYQYGVDFNYNFVYGDEDSKFLITKELFNKKMLSKKDNNVYALESMYDFIKKDAFKFKSNIDEIHEYLNEELDAEDVESDFEHTFNYYFNNYFNVVCKIKSFLKSKKRCIESFAIWYDKDYDKEYTYMICFKRGLNYEDSWVTSKYYIDDLDEGLGHYEQIKYGKTALKFMEEHNEMWWD